MKDSIYGKTVVLLKAVEAECWNFADGSLHELPEGARIRTEHVSDETHTVVMLVDEKGEAPGVELVRKDGTRQTGYRFVVDNAKLAEATCLDVPRRTRDIVAEMMAWEAGELGEDQTARLFRTLRKDGTLRNLQGCYGREAARLGI
jgi:hypothetical protein